MQCIRSVSIMVILNHICVFPTRRVLLIFEDTTTYFEMVMLLIKAVMRLNCRFVIHNQLSLTTKIA